jgi:hypothetical protein
LRTSVRNLCVLCAGFFIVVGPWIGRNVHEFGDAQISLRGGLALYTRALFNGMTRDEYWGTFYVWAGTPLQPYVGRLLGFGPADMQLGGRLQRLNFESHTDLYDRDLAAENAGRPADAITYYRRGRAERIRLLTEYEDGGNPHPDVAADSALRSEGLHIIAKDIPGDLAMSIPLTWRSGHWGLPVLLLTLVYGLRARSGGLTSFVLPGLILLAFYALVTPFEPRWTSVVQPVAVIMIVVLAQALWRWKVRGVAESSLQPIAVQER